jgi:hypothetical protein
MVDRKHQYTRRDFMRQAAAAAGATAMSLVPKKGAAQTASARSSKVVLVRDENALDAGNDVRPDVLKKMLAAAVIQVTGQKTAILAWKSLFKPSDRIGLVHTNHLNKTHQELIDAVKEALSEAGIPEDRIVMAQGNPDKPEACTALIAIPALKAHWLTGIGTVLKNYITFSGRPDRYHAEDSVKLGEIWKLPCVAGKTRLVLVDALYPLCDKGPQPDPRYRWAYKGLIAGRDPVAVETVCLKIIVRKRDLIKGEPWPLSPPPVCVEAADKTYGLGTSRWDEIKLEKAGWTADALV